ncbi:hypothetical protein FHG71_02930 [Rubellimicrobium roseum]|uniref:AAA family ATPase n=2 Tax=Rubellimicrobium roseum TaxID=687525 RepID=A0A5C4NIF4_9RHOB|nr:hypothetical protein FHG71_02930 [Rubellimicrobium roseum]
MHQPILSLRNLAAALDGDVTGPESINAPGPGHSPKDRSLSVKLAPDNPDGFVVHSHAGDDWQKCRDHVLQCLGRAPWTPRGDKERQGGPGRPQRKVAEYVYHLEDGTPYLKVTRLKDPKSFPQEHWTGTGWAKGKPKGPKVPYRLPELLASPHAPVLIAEGEKDADALDRLGLVATTASEGAGKWTSDLNRWFTGRIVYILPDNDEAGRAHARQVAESLLETAAEVRIVALPGLPEKGDVSDWIASDGDIEELLRLCQETQPWRPQETAHNEAASRASRFYSAASLKGRPVPERPWLVPGLVPDRTVTLFSGDGGTGKSLLAHQLGIAVASGCGWLGMDVAQGRVIYLSAEDDDDELHRRTDDILRAIGRTYDDIEGLTLRSLAGEDALLAVESGLALMASALFQELEARAADEQPALVVIDTLADVYPANENDRMKVRQFIGILRGLAIRQRCAVMLLGHPSLTGLTSGSGSSGSTAWNNSVRSRLYLSRIIQDGHEPEPDKRVLTTKKANYSRVGGEIGMTWRGGVFVADVAPSGLDKMAAGAKAERVFLKLLDEFTSQGRRVNHAGASTYAPSQFAKHPKSEGVTKNAFAAAMNSLLSNGTLAIGEEGPPSRRVKFLMRAIR